MCNNKETQNSRWTDALVGRFGWEFIVRIRNAFVTKAITGISLSALALNSLGFFEHLVDGALLNFKLTLLGSTIFLIGYLFSNLKTPYEFQTGFSVPQLVVQKTNISSPSYVEKTLSEAQSLTCLTRENRPFDLPDVHLDYLDECLRDMENMEESKAREVIGSLFDAELRVREWSQPKDRMICVALFGVGFLLIALPTLFALIQILFR